MSVIEYLFENIGPIENPEQTKNNFGNTPIHLAAENNENDEILKFLFIKFPDVNINNNMVKYFFNILLFSFHFFTFSFVF